MDASFTFTRPVLPPAPAPHLVAHQDTPVRAVSLAPATEALSNRLAQVIDGQVSLRTPTSDVLFSDDSSLSREEGGFSDGAGGLDDGDTASDSEDSEERLERVLNSSDTNGILDNLKLTMSPSKIPDIGTGELLELLGEPIADSHVTEEVLVDEFPLFPNRIRKSNIIDEERALSTPEKRGFHQIDDSSSEEGSISKRTRSSLQDVDSLSPISRKMQQFQNSKSKIPLPVAQIAVRRSKRLEQPEDTKRACSPKKIDVPLKPVLKIKSTALNYIVDASSGFLHDATKYATEMNSLNGEGVPIPQTANELVTIPINERKAAKNSRSALLRGTLYKPPKAFTGAKVVGFYSEEQFKKYWGPSAVVEDVQIAKKEKKLRWAEELEW